MRTLRTSAAAIFLAGLAWTVSAIQAADNPGPFAVSGTITQASANKITVQPTKGEPVAVTLNDATVVKVNGEAAKAADLKVGMNVGVFGQHLSTGQAATEIRAYTPREASSQPASREASSQPAAQVTLTGAITQVGVDKIVVQPNNRQPTTVTYNNATVVKINGKVAKAEDLKAGMSAAVIGQHLSTGQAATEIRAYTVPGR